jgi:methylthioribose-1-phosphate isomerase
MASPVPVKRDPAGNVLVLDQSRLPAEETWKSCSSAEQVRNRDAIQP